jgi:protein TonB
LRLAFSSPAPPGSVRPPLRERATSLVLAVAFTLLMIAAMLALNGTAQQRPQFKGSPVMLDLKDDEDAADATPKPSPKPAPARPEPAAAQPPEPPRPVPPPLPVPEDISTHYIHLTPQENQAADISKHPRVAMSSGSTSVGMQQGSSAGDSRPIGTAPNGQPLYAAQWYRRPTDAELAYYLPPHMPSHGIGVVACRTIANHHVDDCVELGSSPAGSHLAGAVRQAAWQFLVRPPRLGGKELVGAWVSIEIDYDRKPAEGTEAAEAAAPPPGD